MGKLRRSAVSFVIVGASGITSSESLSAPTIATTLPRGADQQAGDLSCVQHTPGRAVLTGRRFNNCHRRVASWGASLLAILSFASACGRQVLTTINQVAEGS